MPIKKTFTLREYFALESASDTRYEFLNGEIVAMSGASLAHNRIVLDTASTLSTQLRDRGCEVFVADTRVKIDAATYVYPDIAVVCGQILVITESGLETLLAPTVLIEVLSPSTETYDRGEKFRRYQAIDSLQEYILIAQDRPRIERFTRQPDRRWVYSVAEDLNAAASLDSFGVHLPLSEVYRRVNFDGTDVP